MPVPEQPESMLYFLLTTPRVAAPRWFHEGIAVFLDTWMAGGLGRAQSGYDEMVFRSMVKDGRRFYDPLGLVSEGTKIDFQLQINSYLYGTRFMPGWRARYSARETGGVGGPPRRQPRLLRARSSSTSSACRSSEAWARWATDEREFQQRNLAAIREYPLTPYTRPHDRRSGSVSRAFYDPTRRNAVRRLQLSGRRRPRRIHRRRHWPVERLADIKGPVIYTVTSLARDPVGRHALLHHRQRRLARSRALDVDDAAQRS